MSMCVLLRNIVNNDILLLQSRDAGPIEVDINRCDDTFDGSHSVIIRSPRHYVFVSKAEI